VWRPVVSVSSAMTRLGSKKERGTKTNHGICRGSCFATHQVGPTSLKRGEGPFVNSSCVVESEVGSEEEGGGGGMSGGWTNINRDGVDVPLKLRSPSKIAFDINAQLHNKKIKNSIILHVLHRYSI